MLLEINVQFRNSLVQVQLIVTERGLVSELVLPVVFALLLDGVVAQVDLPVEGIHIEQLSRCAQIAIQVVVPLEMAVDRSDEGKAADIELPAFEESGVLDVLLENECSCAIARLYYVSDL